MIKITFSHGKKHAWLGQPHLDKNLENKFGGLVHKVWSHKIRGTHKFLIVRPKEENEKINQWDYRLGVGMLLYLVKHLRPNLTNATRELLKVNDSANPTAYKELLCVIKYVMDIQNLGLEIKPTGNSKELWKIVCFSYSDYAGDPVNRQSISGFILYVLGILVSWRSKL